MKNPKSNERQALMMTAPLELAEPSSGEKGFLITAYTGATVSRYFGDLVIDVAGIKAKAKMPILRQHDAKDIVGFSSKVSKKDGNLMIKGDFSKSTPAGQEVAALAAEGFPWQASIGVWPRKVTVLETEKDKLEVNGKKMKGPLEVWTESDVREVSFVALGADDNTSVQFSDGPEVTVKVEHLNIHSKEKERMISKLIEILGLKAETEEGEILEVIKSNLVAALFLEDMGEVLGVNPTPSEIKGAVLALKTSPDVITRLQGEVDQLKAERASEAAEKQLESALRAGKITPAMREWALNYAKTDPAGFEAYVANAPKVVPVGEKLEHEAEGAKTDSVALSPEDKKIAALLGVSEENYLKSKIELAERIALSE